MIHRLGATPDLSWLHLTALVARAHLLWETTSPLHEIRIRTTHVITPTDVGPVFVCGWAIGRIHGHGHEWRLKWWKTEKKSEVSFYWLMLMREILSGWWMLSWDVMRCYEQMARFMLHVGTQALRMIYVFRYSMDRQRPSEATKSLASLAMYIYNIYIYMICICHIMS